MLGSQTRRCRMCQAFEAESRLITAMEEKTCIKGFLAARDGKQIKENPYNEIHERYEYEAWQHGWLCWTCSLPTLPWSVEKRIDPEKVKEIATNFRATRELPSQLLEELDYYQ